MKCLFLKQARSCGGPWSSFDYDKVSPEWILSKTYSKAGHPFPMICLLKMDCRIIKDLPDQTWFRHIMKDNQTLVDKYTHGAVDIHDVDFSQYDVVWSEDAFVPESITRKYPQILWAYNNAEHAWPTNGSHYDYFFDHTKHDYPSFKQLSMDVDRTDDIFVEWRTQNIDGIERLTQKTGLKCDIDKRTIQSIQMIHNPPLGGDEYWKRLKRCKYYIQLPVNGNVRIGQGFVDAASMDLICIGKATKQKCVHSFCYANTIDDAIQVIQNVKNNSAFEHEIRYYQNDMLKEINQKFVFQVKCKLKAKRGKEYDI